MRNATIAFVLAIFQTASVTAASDKFGPRLDPKVEYAKERAAMERLLGEERNEMEKTRQNKKLSAPEKEKRVSEIQKEFLSKRNTERLRIRTALRDQMIRDQAK